MYRWHTTNEEHKVYIERGRWARSQAMADLWNETRTRVARGAHRFLADFRRWRERARTVRALSALDNGALKDLGIARSEIFSLADEAASRTIPVHAHQYRAERLRADALARHPSFDRGRHNKSGRIFAMPGIRAYPTGAMQHGTGLFPAPGLEKGRAANSHVLEHA